MKKKLNLLWNLKFNFFSVAERPLTFFAYFLNAKKVGRRRLVISPAKAGAFLFSHTRLPLSPRLLLPFGRISPAAKPGWPVIGPAFWVCRAKAGTAFRCAKPPCAVVRFAAMASPPRTAILPFPSRLRRAGSPTAKPRRLSPFGSISLRETALAGHRPHLLGLPRKIARGISLREPTLADVLACPVYRTENALFCSCRVFQYLTMQVKAPFY